MDWTDTSRWAWLDILIVGSKRCPQTTLPSHPANWVRGPSLRCVRDEHTERLARSGVVACLLRLQLAGRTEGELVTHALKSPIPRA